MNFRRILNLNSLKVAWLLFELNQSSNLLKIDRSSFKFWKVEETHWFYGWSFAVPRHLIISSNKISKKESFGQHKTSSIPKPHKSSHKTTQKTLIMWTIEIEFQGRNISSSTEKCPLKVIKTVCSIRNCKSL